MAHLEIQAVNKRFGDFVALDDVSLNAEQGEFIVLLGPSGCGKTTLLRTLAGLERQDSGRIFHAGKDISAAPPAQRDYGIVFQSYALFPNLTVAENVAYGLPQGRQFKEHVAKRVDEMLALVGLPGSDLKYPAQMSGGQQQRVALARALATAPDLLLLDEPLSALDAIERVRLRGEIRRLQERLGVTTLMVTHDQEEALAVADRVVVMNKGRIQQSGSPQNIYSQPQNAFVADFIGRANIIEAQALPDRKIQVGLLTLRCESDLVEGVQHRFYVRPESIRISNALAREPNAFYARVKQTEFLGAHSLVTCRVEGADNLHLVAQVSANHVGRIQLKPGVTLQLSIPPNQLMPLPEST